MDLDPDPSWTFCGHWTKYVAKLVPVVQYSRYIPVYPGSEFFPSRIPIIELKYFNPKNCCLISRKCDPGCSSRIRILIFCPSRIPGSKRLRIRIRNTEYNSKIYKKCVAENEIPGSKDLDISYGPGSKSKSPIIYGSTGSRNLPGTVRYFWSYFATFRKFKYQFALTLQWFCIYIPHRYLTDFLGTW